MKLSTAVIVSWLIGNAQYVLGRSSGNTCQIPEGPFEKSCTNIAIEFCTNNQYAKNRCKLTADCDSDANPPYVFSNHNELYFPVDMTFTNVLNNNGTIFHPVLDRINKNLEGIEFAECNPCLLPEGCYKNSCPQISITYLPELNGTETPCLFQADCSQNMIRNEARHNVYPRSPLTHNEAMLPKNVLFSGIKNYHGTVGPQSEEFKVTTDQCYARNSTEEVAGSQASRFNAERYLSGMVLGAGLALTLG